MKRFLTSLIVLLAFASGPALAQYENWPQEDLFDGKGERYGHLEYFGFYASAMGGWNFTRDLAPFTNLTWIKTGSASDPGAAITEMVSRLQEAKDAGVMAVLDLEYFLFQDEQGNPRPPSEIEDFLIELRAHLEVDDLLDTLAMIYPKDEPFRNFVDARDPKFISKYVTGKVYLDVHADLFLVNEQVKLVFPEKPIGVILSGYDLQHRFFSIPENYDWIGFDCYDDLFHGCEDRSFVEQYTRLLEFMQPHQRLMAVPETWARNSDLNLADWPDILLSRLRQHYEMALNEPRFVAFIPFIWSFDSDQETPGLGLNRFPELYDVGAESKGTDFLSAVLDVGRQIKTGTHENPNMAWQETENSPYRQPGNIHGGILGMTANGVISAWAIDDALPHKNLRMQVFVRNARGKVLFRSAMERTFVRDPALQGSQWIGQDTIGLHGYRYQIPQKILSRHSKQTWTIDLVTYADGEEADIGAIFSARKGRFYTHHPRN
jgi:hypothetical protein